MKRYIALVIANILVLFLFWFTQPIDSGTVTRKAQHDGHYQIYAVDQYGRQATLDVSESAWDAAKVGDYFTNHCVCILRPKK